MVTLDDVRRMALSLPETSERLSYGTPAFFVHGKQFARIREEGDVMVVYVADEAEKETLVRAEPARFFTTPHYDGYAVVLVRMNVIGLAELNDLVAAAWRVRAPKRLLS